MAYHSAWGGWSESDWYDDRKVIPCECGAVYPRHSRSVNASSVNGIANGCTACKPSNRKRTIHRDVAVRYLQRFGGSTFSVQTQADAAEIYLENVKGQIIGSVSYLDKYPKPPETKSEFASMPF